MPRPIHFEIHAADPQRAIAFYQKLFGWQFTAWEGPMPYWVIKTGDGPGIDGGLLPRRGGLTPEAPVIAYVPEGRIEPPTQHMRYPGTITVPDAAFEATLEGAARSLRRHGLRDVVLLGDHGGYRASLERVAAKLNREWGGAARVHALPEYYRAAGDFDAALEAQGFAASEIGPHAGLADTALMLALDPSQVHMDVAAARSRGAVPDGVAGDPRRASAELGCAAVEHIVAVSVAAIRARARPQQRSRS